MFENYYWNNKPYKNLYKSKVKIINYYYKFETYLICQIIS